jgi:hypothetical protein
MGTWIGPRRCWYCGKQLQLAFQVTPIGCGLAGYTPQEIAPMFADAPANCQLPPVFLPYLKAKGDQ